MRQPELLITPNAFAALRGISQQRVAQLIAQEKLPRPKEWDGQRRAWRYRDAIAWVPKERLGYLELRGGIRFAYVAVPLER